MSSASAVVDRDRDRDIDMKDRRHGVGEPYGESSSRRQLQAASSVACHPLTPPRRAVTIKTLVTGESGSYDFRIFFFTVTM